MPIAGQPTAEPLEATVTWLESVAFSPRGDRLASTSDDGTVRLWNADNGQQIGEPLKGHTGIVWRRGVQSGRGPPRLGGDDGTVRLWNADSGQQIGEPLAGHTDMVLGVAFSPDGRRLATASTDGTVRLWNVDSGQRSASRSPATMTG